MAENVYDDLRAIELDSSAYARLSERSNQSPNAQQRNSLIKKTTEKRFVFLWTGIIIGSVLSGITVFSVVKYGGILTQNVYTCFWTEWTSWTPCKSSLITGKQTRTQTYTGLFKTCEEKNRYETKSCYDITDIFFDRTLDIRFDQTKLYSTRYLSRDYATLSNMNTDRTPYKPNAQIRFHNYTGAMVNTCIEQSTSIYFEIYFQYVITFNLSENMLVLEIGIGERHKIDNYHYVGSSVVNGWSFNLRNCEIYNKVCLWAEHRSRNIHNRNNTKLFSNNTAGTNFNGTFGILIDRERNKFSLFYNKTVLFTFHEVLSNVSLCPVFGLYNSYYVNVDLQIMSVGNMTSVF